MIIIAYILYVLIVSLRGIYTSIIRTGRSLRYYNTLTQIKAYEMLLWFGLVIIAKDISIVELLLLAITATLSYLFFYCGAHNVTTAKLRNPETLLIDLLIFWTAKTQHQYYGFLDRSTQLVIGLFVLTMAVTLGIVTDFK